MKYQIGDKILILHSGEEGDVIDIISDTMMLVAVGGVQFPVYMDQVDFPYFKWFTGKKTGVAKKDKQFVDNVRKEKIDRGDKVADGMWLTFLPITETDETGHEVVRELKMHLINNTHDAYCFKYRQSFFGKHEFFLDNRVHPFEDFYIHDLLLTDLSDSPVFEFEFTLLQPDKIKADYYPVSLKLKPKQIFEKIGKMKKDNEATFSNRLFEKFPDRMAEDTIELHFPSAKPKVFNAAHAREHIEPATPVVDLHLEKLADNTKGLSNIEILNIQLKAFEKYYDLAVVHLQPFLIVIHGVGEGKLREAIHDILHTKKEVRTFVNQYHPLYGFGATEILFQY